MNNSLLNSVLTICRTLEKYDIRYIIVGGTAVALNGYYRRSCNRAGELTDKPDIDVWFNPTYDNYFKILKTIEELGHDVTDLKNEKSPDPRKSFLRLDFDNFTLDFLPEIRANIRFNEAYRRKETIKIRNTEIHYMSYSDIVNDKEATARKKDKEDIKQLKKIKGDE